MATDYDNEFFESHELGATESANVVVPLIRELVEPDSVVDVGCGTGVWLSTFMKHGVTDILGIDGDYIDEKSLKIPANEFRAIDLEQPFELERRFDLAVCLEVAEHLSPKSAENFVACLCELAPVTLFSAAIPFQGGVNHINEQWPEYWEKYFNDHGFVALDPIRPEIWRNDDVDFWYAQNLLLYVQKNQFPKNLTLRKFRKTRGNNPLSIVHPTHYMETVEKLSDALRTYEHYAKEARVQESSAADLQVELNRTTSELEHAKADAETAQAQLESETWRLEDEIKAAREWAEQRGQKIALLRDETNAIQSSAERLTTELAHYKLSADPRNMPLARLIKSLGRSIRSLPKALAGAVLRRKKRLSTADVMYVIVEIELTREFVTLKTADDVHGFGFVVRQNDRPVGFFMVPIPPNTKLEPMDVRELILENINSELMEGTELPTAGIEDSNPQDPSLTVTVAICTKDHPEDLKNCLTHLQTCRASNSGEPFDILVVDNAPSSPASRDIIATMPEVRYVVEPKPGLNFARNRALREARSDIIAFIDDDVTIDRTWYRGLMRALENHPDAGAVTGLVLPAELQTRAQILFEANGGFEKSYQTIRYEKTLPGHPFYPCIGGKFGTGCNMAFRREVLLELDGFDEALDTGAALPGGGDTDMLYRVVRAGYPLIYEPEYVLFHRHRREYHQLRNQLRKSWGEGLMAFVVKTYKLDPTQRGNLRRLVGWWFTYHLRQLFISIAGRHVLPPDILAAQLWGGIVGILISYPRSVRRTKQIRKQYS